MSARIPSCFTFSTNASLFPSKHLNCTYIVYIFVSFVFGVFIIAYIYENVNGNLLGNGVLACGENLLTLCLTSELVDLRAANANLIPRRFACGASFEATSAAAKQKSHPIGWLFYLYRGYKKDILGDCIKVSNSYEDI
jgi:hypothetical protein